MKEKSQLIIFDSNSVIHRAFHALPPLTNRKGEAVGAVYGFLLVFLKVIKEFQPEFMAACFDVKGPTFRHKKYEQYKAKRPKAPPELYSQIPTVKSVLSSFGVPVYEQQGFEGDDLIGTIAKLAPVEVIIVSGDSDNLQLVDERVKVYALRKGVKDIALYDEALVAEKYRGLKPSQLIDYRALRGDPTDNIPGVKGIGEKTATDLLAQFGTLENIYQNLGNIKLKIQDMLLHYKADALASKDLAAIIQNVPMDFNLQNCRWSNYDKQKAAQVLRDLGFLSLIPRLP